MFPSHRDSTFVFYYVIYPTKLKLLATTAQVLKLVRYAIPLVSRLYIESDPISIRIGASRMPIFLAAEVRD